MAFSITSSFDPAYYLSQNPDVAAAIEAGIFESAEQHFNQFGFSEGRDPNPYFDTSFYLEQNPDVAAAGINPLNHFNQFGETEGRSPNAIFNPTYYLEQNPDVAASGISPFLHFINHGAGEGRSPNASVASQTSEGFDEAAYLAANPDIADAIANGTLSSGFEHWLLFGFDEGRSGAQNAAGDPIDQPNNSGTPSGNPDDSPADPDVPGAGGGGGTPDTTPPAITSSSTFAINENETDVGTITANEASTFSLIGGDDQALFQIDPNTGELTFASAPDFENPQDAGSNNVYEVEVEAQDAAGNTSTAAIAVTVEDAAEVNGGTIQAAINAATAGDTIYVAAGTYAENLIIDKAITIKALNGGDVDIAPTSGVAVTFATGVDGDVTLDGLDLVGNGTTTTTGINVPAGAKITTLTFTNGEISGFKDRGIFSTDAADPINAPAMDAIVVSDSEFTNNGTDDANTNTSHIKLFGHAGEASFINLVINAAANEPDVSLRPANAIEIVGDLFTAGSANTGTIVGPDISVLTFDNVDVNGQFAKNPIGIFNFGNIDNLSISNLDLSDAEAEWLLFNIHGVTSDFDASTFGIIYPTGSDLVADLQGEKDTLQGEVNSTITGSSANEYIKGFAGDDTLSGEGGNDLIAGGSGNDQLDGGDGTDTALFSGNILDYDISELIDGSFSVNDQRTDSPDGNDVLANIEQAIFTNGTSSTADDQTLDLTNGLKLFDLSQGVGVGDVIWETDRRALDSISTGVDPIDSTNSVLAFNIDESAETSGFHRYQGAKIRSDDGNHYIDSTHGSEFSVDLYVDPTWATDGTNQQTGVWIQMQNNDKDLNGGGRFSIAEYLDAEAMAATNPGFDLAGAAGAIRFWNSNDGWDEYLAINDTGWINFEFNFEESSNTWDINGSRAYEHTGPAAAEVDLLETVIFNSQNYGTDETYVYDNIVVSGISADDYYYT